MKRLYLSCLHYLLPVVTFVFVGSRLLHAQTISTDPLPESAYCIGDSIDVSFTVSGGTLNTGNAFLVQLSGPDGDFAGNGQRILGSRPGTSSGSIRVPLPKDIEPSTMYRFRVAGSNPVIIGSDNGSDIELVASPSFYAGFPEFAVTDTELTVEAGGDPGQTYHWYFGGGSSPEASVSLVPPPITYLSAGPRTITLKGTNSVGCTRMIERDLMVYERNPVIPSDVIIITDDSPLDSLPYFEHASFWVCPGGTLRFYGRVPRTATVYAEFGAVVEMTHGSDMVVYAKGGAEIRNADRGYDNPIIAEEEAIIKDEPEYRDEVVRVSSITFDYSQVPANGCPSLAPYTVQVNPDSRSIHSEESEEGSGEDYFINPGATLTSTGDDNTYLVESGGSLVIRGSNSLIYLRDGASLDVLEGSGHRIIYEQKAVIDSPGEDPILLPSSGITFVGQVSSVEGENLPAPEHLDIE